VFLSIKKQIRVYLQMELRASGSQASESVRCILLPKALAFHLPNAVI